MRHFRFLTILLAAAFLGQPARAVDTKAWTQSTRAEFEKGKLKQLSLGSDGRVTLAPQFRELLDSSTPYLWALAEDSTGNLYAGSGNPNASKAKLFRIDPSGNSKVLAELDGIEIHSLAVDAADRVYAATSPDGKVYRVAADGKVETFYEPKTKYIWAMVLAGGDLFLATGDKGEIHRVTADGKGSVFFQTEEAHARSLAVDAGGNLIVGTEPSGLILRVPVSGAQSGKGFVIHQAEKREVTAIAVAPDGSIYAAAVGTKQAPSTPPPAPAPSPAPQPASPAPQPGGTIVIGQRTTPTPPPTLAPAGPLVTGGSEVYRIDSEGYPAKVWSHAQEIAYAIAFDARGRPLVGTGNRGNVYRIDSDLLHTLLLSASPTQVTALAAGRGGKVYAGTGNIGKVFQVGPALEKEGTLESDVLDTGYFSYWGRLTYEGAAAGGSVSLASRSGNLDRPQQHWSPWAAAGDRVTSPAARFLQWRLTLKAAAGGGSPEVTSVEAAYLPRNVAPVIEQIEITPPNYRFPAQTLSITPSQSLTLPPLARDKQPSSPKTATPSGSATLNYAKGYLGARWRASDLNGDELTYKVEIRGVTESEWKLLKDKLKDASHCWDSTAFPDGEYKLRITVSDSPDNPPDKALSRAEESETFLVDNTPPQISGLAAAASGSDITVKWRASDASTILSKAEYSLNGGEWTVVEPTTRLSDARQLDYQVTIRRAAPGEATIAIRVADYYDNQAVEKVVVR